MAPSNPAPSASTHPIPATLDEITLDWVRAALADDAMVTGEVAGVEVEPLGADVGLLGDLARLHLTYRPAAGTSPDPGPATMIVKLPTTDPGGHQVGAMLRAWAREVAFYQEVAPATPGARVPHCHHAAADPEGGRWVVILENCPAQPVDTGVGATPAQAEAAIDALAAFHATWWGRDAFEWMPGFDTTGVGGLRGAWADAFPSFAPRYRHVLPDGTEAWLDQLPGWLPAWSDQAGAEPLTVVHADYRLDNLLLAGDQVTMIDWQTALRGPGAMDLSSFLATSLTVPDRRALEADLIDRYLHRLGAGGVDQAQLDPAWFHRSYDQTLLWWCGQFASNLARLEPDDPATQRTLDTMIERTYTAAADRDAGRLLTGPAGPSVG